MQAETCPPARLRGRPRRITDGEVTACALDLFARRGFEETTVDDIAAELGVGRRTLFRYFSSKNDMVWGNFNWVLDRLRADLDAAPPDQPVMEALTGAVVSSNHYPSDQLPELRMRMTLITTVPALQGHSMVRYAAWRGVVAEFVASRRGEEPTDLVPLTVGYAALGASMAAFARWVANPGDDLEENLRRAYRILEDGLTLG